MARHDDAVRPETSTEPSLRRSIGLVGLTLYGLGTTIGAGIFALLGVVVAEAGSLAPLAFGLASLLATLSALSYAELSVRLPRAGGDIAYVQAGFERRWLSRAVGLLVVTTGVISSATVIRGAAGYLEAFVDVPPPVWIGLVVLLLGLLASWGISESVIVASAFSLIEIAALVLIVTIGAVKLGTAPSIAFAPLLPTGWNNLLFVVTGAFVAFFAFLGFEDMVAIAEEVERPERAMPIAILLTLAISAALYMSLALVAISVVPAAELGKSDAPMALIYSRTTGYSPLVVAAVSVMALLNGALVQIIKSARAIYGLASEGLLPRAAGAVHARTRTPLRATIAVGVVVLALALSFRLEHLAALTSATTLSLFALSSFALCRMKMKGGPAPSFQVPFLIPVVAGLSSLAFIGLGLWGHLAR